jgi:hypothetical protein
VTILACHTHTAEAKEEVQGAAELDAEEPAATSQAWHCWRFRVDPSLLQRRRSRFRAPLSWTPRLVCSLVWKLIPACSQIAEAKEQIQGAAELDAEELAKEQIDRAVDIVAEMQLTSDQLKVFCL